MPSRGVGCHGGGCSGAILWDEISRMGIALSSNRISRTLSITAVAGRTTTIAQVEQAKHRRGRIQFHGVGRQPHDSATRFSRGEERNIVDEKNRRLARVPSSAELFSSGRSHSLTRRFNRPGRSSACCFMIQNVRRSQASFSVGARIGIFHLPEIERMSCA